MSEDMRERMVAKIRANLSIPSPNGPTLLPYQSETLNRFDDEGVAKNALNTISARLQYLHNLRHLGLMFPKPYKEFTKEDMIQYLNKPVTGANGIKRPMAYNTKRCKKRIVKSFYRWLFELPEKTYPPSISWIGKPGKATSSITTADLLTVAEILALLRAANIQSRARIGVHHDTAGRAHEIHDLTKRDVELDSFGYRITLRGRPGSTTKGGSRTVPMVTHAKYLTTWINEHPTWETEDNPTLWISTRDNGPLIDSVAWGKKLHRIARWANISKRVNPHIFRHTKLTDCARMGMTEYTMRKFAGWSATSNQCATYVHLSGKSMEFEALRVAGKDVPPARPMFADIVTLCPHCHEENDLHVTYCYSCSASLDGEKYVREETRKMADLLNSHEGMKKQLIELLQQSPS